MVLYMLHIKSPCLRNILCSLKLMRVIVVSYYQPMEGNTQEPLLICAILAFLKSKLFQQYIKFVLGYTILLKICPNYGYN